MKREVTVKEGKVVVRPKSDDAIARLRQLNLRQKLVNNGRLTDAERDAALLAMLQHLGLI